MAGDRRATMGNYIAQRDIEKVFHADDYSCVGIAGAAGIAIEMVRLFQVELEHYEKIEGTTLSLEGKANRLALMIRGNLAMAMQGLAVVPLFAGYDLEADDPATAGRHLLLRRHRRALRGAQVPLGRLRLAVRPRRAEEALARRPLRRRRRALRRPVALRRGRRGLARPAAPTSTRRIFPVVATVTVDGFRRLADDEVGERRRDGRRRPDGEPRRPAGTAATDHRPPHRPPRTRGDRAVTHAVRLRLARAADEGPGRLRPQGHRARPQRRRPAAYDDGILFVAENLSRALHKISEIYDRIAFAAVGKYNEFENLRIGRRPATPTCAATPTTASDVTGRGLANAYAQTLGTIFTSESKPYEVEIVVAEVGETAAEDQIYRLTYDGSVADEHGFVAMGGSAETITPGADRAGTATGMTLAEALRLAVELLGRDPATGEPRTLTADQLEVAVLDRARPRRKFRRLTGPALAALLGGDDTAGAEAGGPTRGPSRRPRWPAGPTSRPVRTGTPAPDRSRRQPCRARIQPAGLSGSEPAGSGMTGRRRPAPTARITVNRTSAPYPGCSARDRPHGNVRQ